MTKAFKMHPHKDDLIAGISGFLLTTFGVVTSLQEQLLWTVQFLSALGAALVAALTIWKLTRKK